MNVSEGAKFDKAGVGVLYYSDERLDCPWNISLTMQSTFWTKLEDHFQVLRYTQKVLSRNRQQEDLKNVKDASIWKRRIIPALLSNVVMTWVSGRTRVEWIRQVSCWVPEIDQAASLVFIAATIFDTEYISKRERREETDALISYLNQ
jgi:hypothetical protein